MGGVWFGGGEKSQCSKMLRKPSLFDLGLAIFSLPDSLPSRVDTTKVLSLKKGSWSCFYIINIVILSYKLK